MKEPSETKIDLFLIILFAFFAGTFFGAFGVLCDQYFWDPNPKESTVSCFIAMILLVFVLLFIAVNIGKDVKRRFERKNKND